MNMGHDLAPSSREQRQTKPKLNQTNMDLKPEKNKHRLQVTEPQTNEPWTETNQTKIEPNNLWTNEPVNCLHFTTDLWTDELANRLPLTTNLRTNRWTYGPWTSNQWTWVLLPLDHNLESRTTATNTSGLDLESMNPWTATGNHECMMNLE